MSELPTRSANEMLGVSLREIARRHFVGDLIADAVKEQLMRVVNPDFPLNSLEYAFRRFLRTSFPDYRPTSGEDSRFFYNKPLVYYKGPTVVQQGDVLVPHQTSKTLVPTRTSYLLGQVAANLATERSADKGAPARVFEFGVGTGLVGASLLRHASHRPVSYVGGDIDPVAIDFAANALTWNGFRPGKETLRCGDGFRVLRRKRCLDVMVSNPPYYPSAKAVKRQSSYIGPRVAIDGGDDGLDFYRRILAEAGTYLEEGGWCVLQTPECIIGEVLDLAQQNYPASTPRAERLEARRTNSDFFVAVQAA